MQACFTVAYGYAYAKLFANPNTVGRVITYAWLAYAGLWLTRICLGTFGLTVNSKFAVWIQVLGWILLGFGLLMVLLAQPLKRPRFARLASLLVCVL